MKLPEILLTLRTNLEATQSDVATALGVSDKTISKWETGASSPDLDMLCALASYYHVTTDYLLGLSSVQHVTLDEQVTSAFADLTAPEGALTAFHLNELLLPILFSLHPDGNEAQAGCTLPPVPGNPVRSCISSPNLYQLTLRSRESNFCATMLRNEANFQWLRDADAQADMVRHLRFFSSAEALSLCAFLYAETHPQLFSLPFVAKKTGIAQDNLLSLMEQACELGFCNVHQAHMASGNTTLYESSGTALPLLLLSVVRELSCPGNCHNYYLNAGNQMIGGHNA